MKKILVADDNRLSRELLKAIVKQHGYDVVEAKDGQEVLQILNQEEIDLIFMDCSMPYLSGMEVSIQIRNLESPHKSNVKIVGVSAHGTAVMEQCLQAGMDQYMTKPISIADVRLVLDSISTAPKKGL